MAICEVQGSGGSAVPLERLEAQICELAGHLAAATCRFLILLGDFDARRGWASWNMRSCAEWLSWKCQMSAGAAREHVRVVRALRDLPVIRTEFGAGRLSYAKVPALTRIATVENEGGLAEIAGPMTGNQLERFARAGGGAYSWAACTSESYVWSVRVAAMPREQTKAARSACTAWLSALSGARRSSSRNPPTPSISSTHSEQFSRVATRRVLAIRTVGR
jgi:hypothetical protein